MGQIHWSFHPLVIPVTPHSSPLADAERSSAEPALRLRRPWQPCLVYQRNFCWKTPMDKTRREKPEGKNHVVNSCKLNYIQLPTGIFLMDHSSTTANHQFLDASCLPPTDGRIYNIYIYIIIIIIIIITTIIIIIVGRIFIGLERQCLQRTDKFMTRGLCNWGVASIPS